jgi:predicted transcriptional regulator
MECQMRQAGLNGRHDKRIIDATTDIVAAYVARASMPMTEIVDLIHSVHSALARLDGEVQKSVEKPAPAVPIGKSITPNYLICLEDGGKFTMLKRHLRTAYGMTPDEYRAKWGLPRDYPMAAPNYTRSRSNFAKQTGFGTKKSARREAVSG